MHDWVGDAFDMLDHIISQQQESHVILIGSSLGAWISLVLAMKRPDVITAVIGIGSAIDYTSHIYHAKLTGEQRNAVEGISTSKIFEVSSPLKYHLHTWTMHILSRAICTRVETTIQSAKTIKSLAFQTGR
jgi:pimeloyl-ACP methyl ester carboxylesterase